MDLGQTFSISTLALSFFFGAFCRSGSRPQHTQIRLLYNLGGSRRWLLRQTTLRLFWARFLCNSWGRRPAQKIADTTFWDKLWSVLGFSINPGTGHAHDALASARTPECGCDTHVSQATTGYHPEMPPHGFWARARRHLFGEDGPQPILIHFSPFFWPGPCGPEGKQPQDATRKTPIQPRHVGFQPWPTQFPTGKAALSIFALAFRWPPGP